VQRNVETCRAHGWRYDVCRRKTPYVSEYGVLTYGVKIENGKIFVDSTHGKLVS
jgi:nitrite reductase/ring-hydroxylating ferredoxin subunit